MKERVTLILDGLAAAEVDDSDDRSEFAHPGGRAVHHVFSTYSRVHIKVLWLLRAVKCFMPFLQPPRLEVARLSLGRLVQFAQP
jgi:hypothetical protein